MTQLVSILIPAFDAAKWIRACIESALSQTWSRKEIIIIDDGSRDATFEIARSYESATTQVLSQENRGASATRNRALSLAQGDYIQWLDADDILAPDKIAYQMKQAEPRTSSRVLLSSSWGKFYYRPERSIFTPDSLWENLEPTEWLYRKMHENRWMAIESWLVSRRLTEMAGPWNEEMSLDDDGEYFARVLSHSSGIRYVPEARCFCRRGNIGLSHYLTLDNRKLDSLAASLFSQIEILKSMEDSPRVRKVCVMLLNRWAIEFYPEREDLLREMQNAAAALGGQLVAPELRKKYRWVQQIFGWQMAKKMQNTLPVLRHMTAYALERSSCLFPR